MARIPMVTRTIVSTKAVLFAVNTETQETSNMEVVLPRQYKDKKSALKVAKKLYETDELAIVSIVSLEETETLYGMTETDFIEHATVLPPRSKNEQ